MDLLKRTLAPITDEAWGEIDNQAKLILKGNLSARGIIDFDGPHGWKFAAVNVGCVEMGESGVIEGVLAGKRLAQPLIEVKVPFSLAISEMDDIARGLRSPELTPLIDAARKAAHFEDKAIYLGFEKGGIRGIFKSSEHKPVKVKKEASTFEAEIEEAVLAIQKMGIGGPYHLVLGTTLFQSLMEGDGKGYPLKKRVQEILGGKIVWSPALKGGAVISGRGGDMILTVGQDFSIGYAGHDAEKVNLYVTECFTFQVIEPKSAVELVLQ